MHLRNEYLDIRRTILTEKPNQTKRAQYAHVEVYIFVMVGANVIAPDCCKAPPELCAGLALLERMMAGMQGGRTPGGSTRGGAHGPGGTGARSSGESGGAAAEQCAEQCWMLAAGSLQRFG